MSNKKLRNRDEGEKTPSIFEKRWFTILGGILFVSLFIALGIVIVTALGGDELSKEDPKQPELPALGAAPDVPRSPNADLLASTSFEDMTPEQRKAIADDAARQFANGEVRVSSDQIPGLDIARRDGHTRATRQFRIGDQNPGSELSLITTTIFYCDGPPGTVDIYRVDDSGFEANATYDRKSADSPPFERLFPGADWSAPADLGRNTINGIEVRGVQIKYRPQETADPVDVEHWYDIDTGRLIFYRDAKVDSRFGYYIDWRVPPPIEVPEEMNTPPCASLVTGE